jgi:GH24 family phage-related lysozyme (muramidase)
MMNKIEKLSDKGIQLIIQYETGDKDYYDKFLARPSWPGGASGVTIGCGFDVAYENNLEEAWGRHLTKDQIARLKRCYKVTGSRAKAMLSGLRDIIIPWEDALEVFNESTLPIYIEQTLDAFPNSENLPPDAFGALVSLVFNRGPLVDSSDRRKEMRAIRSILLEGDDDIVDEDDIRRIAAEVRKMARLWPDNKNSDGDLHDRRIAESELILSSI